jgi:hypothetical protein
LPNFHSPSRPFGLEPRLALARVELSDDVGLFFIDAAATDVAIVRRSDSPEADI